MQPEILIDGLNVFMRHYCANPTVSLNNTQCGGILGFLRNIQHLCDRFRPQKVYIVWEGGGSSRRRAIEPNYKLGKRPVKLNRSGYYSERYDTKDNRDSQLKTLIEILKYVPVTQIYVNDCEADDVIGYICKNRKAGHRKIIVTSDKDYYQLINDDIVIWSPNQKKIIDKENIKEKWGVSALNFCTARCFVGDQSDGIKGVKGAGFKTMLKHVPQLKEEEFISVEEIVNQVKNSDNKAKVVNEIILNENRLKKNWQLMYLDSRCLSWTQIKSIKSQYESEVKKENKMDLMRVMMREGLNQFDINGLLFSVNSSVKF